jgi:acetylornithine deacetylase
MTSFQQTELWEVTRQLIAFNTVSALSNLEAAHYLANYLDECGFTTHMLTDTIKGVEKASVVAWAGPASADGLIVSGHTDIVPFDGQPGWQSDPLVLKSDGQRLYGRGVTDMKVFLAQMLLTAKRLPLEQLTRPLVYIFTYDEEVAGQGSGNLVQVLPQLFTAIPLPKIALIGEPSGFEVFPAHKGFGAFDIVVHGKGGHSSLPDRGLNAIANMSHIIQILQETNADLQLHISPINRDLFPENPVSAFNLGVIHGGLAANMIAETCRLTVSLRIAPGDDAAALVARLGERIEREVAQPMKAISADCDARIEECIIAPPLSSPQDAPFGKLLSQIIGKPLDRGAPFATDGGHFQKLGIYSYVCGPGLLGEAHQPNESIPIDHCVLGLERLEQIVHAWCIDGWTA